MGISFSKTPDESKDFTIDWSKDLAGDTIPAGNSAWAVSPSGPSVVQSSVASGGFQTTIRLSGGSNGQVYLIRNLVMTAGGRDLTKTFRLLVVGSNYL
jgi:hypothetical protein